MTTPTIGAIACLAFDHGGMLAPASAIASTFVHPGINGIGAIQGPTRQAGGGLDATTYHGAATRSAALTLCTTLAAMVAVGTTFAIDPTVDASGSITGVIALSVRTRVRPCRGIPGGALFCVIAEWKLLLPINYAP